MSRQTLAQIQSSSALNKLFSTIKEINSICQPISDVEAVEDLPRAFLEVAKLLPDTETTLKHSQERLQRKEMQADDEHYQKLLQTVNGCNDNASTLADIFQYVLYHREQTAPERYQDRASPSETVEKLMIKTLQGLLELAEPPLTLINDEEAARLQAGLKELEKLPPSLLKNKAGNTFINSGAGNMANHVGQGDQYVNNSPSAPMVNGKFMNPVNFYGAGPPADGNSKEQK